MEFDTSAPINQYFTELTRIPRGSYHEKAVSRYLIAFAKDHGLPYVEGPLYDVIISKPAAPGYEKAAPLILQSHIDMVNVKDVGSDHDFSKDPLKLRVVDGWLMATGTTLGADDGVGVAYMLAILADDALAHPALQCIFTAQEETGMGGALALKPSDIHASRMIGLDGGGQNVTLTTCSGGNTAYLRHELAWQANTDGAYRLAVTGLQGGHSGDQIHMQRGNANKIAARILKQLQLDGIRLRLVSLDGGSKGNAIPDQATAVFTSRMPSARIMAALEPIVTAITAELAQSDPGLQVVMTSAKAARCLTPRCSRQVIDMFYLAPDGMVARSLAVKGLTVTSLNLGIVRTGRTAVEGTFVVRSAIDSAVTDLDQRLQTVADMCGGSFAIADRYPGWSYQPVSAMRRLLKQALKKTTGQKLVMEATHGGVECGVFKGLQPKMDIVVVGPRAEGCHTPRERLDIASFKTTYDILVSLIALCR